MLQRKSARGFSTLREKRSALLVLDNVTKDYVAEGEPTRALDSISLALTPGSLWR